MPTKENPIGKALEMTRDVLSQNAQASRQKRAVPFGEDKSRRQVRSDFDSLTPENVIGKALDLVGGVLSEHAQASRQNRAVPFGKDKSRRQVRSDFDSLTPEKLAVLIKEHGRPAVNQWIGRELQLRERRQR